MYVNNNFVFNDNKLLYWFYTSNNLLLIAIIVFSTLLPIFIYYNVYLRIITQQKKPQQLSFATALIYYSLL